jgi:hypothetical protein
VRGRGLEPRPYISHAIKSREFYHRDSHQGRYSRKTRIANLIRLLISLVDILSVKRIIGWYKKIEQKYWVATQIAKVLLVGLIIWFIAIQLGWIVIVHKPQYNTVIVNTNSSRLDPFLVFLGVIYYCIQRFWGWLVFGILIIWAIALIGKGMKNKGIGEDGKDEI